MNETEAQEAIEQMIQFIKSEANDRAMEIRKKTEEECTIGISHFANCWREGKPHLRGQKENENWVWKEAGWLRCAEENVIANWCESNSERSAALSKTKITKMDERNKLMEDIRKEAAERLNKKLTANKELYKSLLKNLILQVCIKPVSIRDSLSSWKSMWLFVAERATRK